MLKQGNTRRGGLPLGALLLIFIGVLMLLENFGIVPSGWWVGLLEYWPLVLIFLGLQMVLRPKFAWVGALVFFAVLATILYLTLGHSPTWNIAVEPITHTEPLGATKQATLSLELSAGQLKLGALPSGSAHLMQAIITGGSFTTSAEREREETRLSFSAGPKKGRLGPPVLAIAPRVTALLSQEASYDLALQLNAADVELSFQELDLRSLALNLNAGRAAVWLPATPNAQRVVIAANAAKVEIVVPEGVAIRLRSQAQLGSIKAEELGLVEAGSYRTTPNYADARGRLDLEIESNASMVIVRRP